MKDKEFNEKTEYIRKCALDCYGRLDCNGTTDSMHEGVIGMMDMIIESILLLTEIINEKED